MRQGWSYRLVQAALVAAVLWLGYRQPATLDSLRNLAFDTFQRLDPPPYDPALPVRVLAVDEASLARFGQWPWPRTRMAEIVDRLHEAGAAAIAFDILFPEPDRTSPEVVVAGLPDGPAKADLLKAVALTPSNDARLAQALAGAPTVLGATMRSGGAEQPWPAKAGYAAAGDPPAPFIPAFATAVVPIPVLAEAAAGLGATNWLPDRDQVLRQVPLFLRNRDRLLPALALDALRVAQGASTYVIRASNASGTSAFGARTGLNAVKVGDVEVATGASGVIRPRYTVSDPRRFLSAADLLAGRVDPEAVRGRVVFVGATAIGLGDIRATPLNPAVPGVEVHAQVLESLLSGRLLSRPDWASGAEFAVTVAGVILIGFFLPRMAPLLGFLVTAWVVVALFVLAWKAFDRAALLLDAAVPSLLIAAAYLCSASLLWQTERRAKRQVRTAFGKFLAPAVVARLAENPRLLRLSGETRDLTILFSDVRNFSTISETLGAEQVAGFLNGYLTPMTDAILRHEGTVDKYIGDAIVAFWNAPLDVARHTVRAVEAALAMRAALAAYNRANREAPDAGSRVQDVRCGIGLNYGSCSVGNMGSVQRFDYSALGDPVNVAARLEALTKTYGVDLLATEAVVARTADHAWLEVDDVKVKGRSASTRLFALAGDAAVARSPGFADWSGRHARMLEASRTGRLREARGLALALAAAVDAPFQPLYAQLAAQYGARADVEVPERVDSHPVGALLAGPSDLAGPGDAEAEGSARSGPIAEPERASADSAP